METLEHMAQLVRVGDFAAAAEVGNAAPVQLAVDKAAAPRGRLLARGSESTIFETTFRQRDAVLKVATVRSTADLQRFRKEVALLCSIAAPNVLQLLAARALPPDYSMVLPRYSATLEALLHDLGWRPRLPEVLNLAKALTSALAAVHAAGVVHRDVKPGNVLLNADGEVVLADFGVAEAAEALHGTHVRAAPSGGFQKERIVGTLQYLPPEVLLNSYHQQASDVYALAVTLNEVATGDIPFSDCVKANPACHTILDAGYGHQELAVAVAAEQLRPCLPSSWPPAWAQLMERCWDVDPSQRPACEAVLEALDALAAAEGVTAATPSDVGAAVAAALRRSTTGEAAEPSAEAPAAPAQPAATPAWQLRAQHDYGAPPPMIVGVYADAGLRGAAKMEDRHVIATPLSGTPRGDVGPSLLVVIDGHRGVAAAEHVAASLSVEVRAAWADANSAEAALGTALSRCEASFAAAQETAWRQRAAQLGPDAAPQRQWPGCTVVAALQVGALLAWANLGDCRALLCRAGRPWQLTRDHTVDDAQEEARISSGGGAVHASPDGSKRIGTARLQVSRSVGDFDAKVEGAAGGLSAEPEVDSMRVTADDEFLVLATDGLWDVMSNEDVVALVHDTVKNPSMAAKRLTMEALARGSRDNVTVLLCFLQDVGTLESVYKAGKQMYAPAATHYGSRASMLQELSAGRAADEVCEQL